VGILIAILVFGLLIVVHEVGHFLAAKAADIKVHEFAIGFGPALARLQRGETQYTLRAFPMGGYVRMAGMDETEEDEPRGYNKKPLGARMMVILAGPLANFLLASLLYSGLLFFVGSDRIEVPVIGYVPPVCDVTVGGEASAVSCPAYEAGLQVGDRILSIDGKAVADWNDILSLVSTSGGKPLTFRIQRGEELLEVVIEPVRATDGRWIVGIRWPTEREPFLSALVKGPVITLRTLGAMLVSLGQMVTGQIEADLTGPVGITKSIAEQASLGWTNLLVFVAFLSLNLGLFNLLPIPALDGSRIAFMLVELVRGRRIDPQRENMVHFVGFLLLLGLMIVVAYSDIMRW